MAIRFWIEAVLLGLLPCSIALAQRLVPGYVVLASGDSIRGAICLRSPLESQTGVRLVPLSANQLLDYRPAQVRAYGYVRGQDTVRYVACPVQLGYPVTYRTGSERVGRLAIINDTVWVLLKQLISGPVQLYERYSAGGGGSAQSLRQYVVRKGRAVPVNTYWWNFPKDAAAFFNDHPALTTQLQSRHYHARDLQTVVRLYNHWQLSAAKK